MTELCIGKSYQVITRDRGPDRTVHTYYIHYCMDRVHAIARVRQAGHLASASIVAVQETEV